MKRDLFGLAALGVATALAGCTDNPTASLSGTAARVAASVAGAEVTVGDSVRASARTLDTQGNPLTTFPEVTSLDANVVTVAVDSTVTGKPEPQVTFFIRGVGFGTTQVVVAHQSLTDTIDVATFPADVAVEGLPDTLRSGESSTFTVRARDTEGNTVSGVPIEFSSSDEDVLALNEAALEVSAIEAGFASINAEAPGDATGTAGVVVIPGPPASAEFEDDSFGAVPRDGTSRLEVYVLDANGNVNHFTNEITSATVTSSDNAIATAAVATADTIELNETTTGRQVLVTVTGVDAGTANISGTVTTSTGTYAYGPIPVAVLNPQITLAAPTSTPGATVVITGTGLQATGFTTRVLVDGNALGNITVNSSTQITAQMPTYIAGTYDLQVSVGGVLSNTDSWTQTTDYDEAATEPNDAQGEETPISASFEFSGSADEDTDFSDLFEFTVTDADLVIDLTLSWGDANDLDVLIYPKGAQDPGTYTEDACDFDLSTLANPEVGVCTLGDAGTYTLEVLHYGSGPTTYTVKGSIRP